MAKKIAKAKKIPAYAGAQVRVLRTAMSEIRKITCSSNCGGSPYTEGKHFGWNWAIESVIDRLDEMIWEVENG